MGSRPQTLNLLPVPEVVDEHRVVSAREVHERALQFASGLLQRGVKRGDVVAFHLPPSLESLVVFHGCWAIGAVAAPLHHRFGPSEVASLVSRLTPAVTLTSFEDVEAIMTPGTADPVELRPSDVAVILATSGSSGRPKLVRHVHSGLAYKGWLMPTVHGLTSEDVVLMPAPLAHISGLLSGILVPGAAGMTVVLMRQWEPELALRLIYEHRITFLVGPPTYFSQLARSASFHPRLVESVRLISCGGTDVTPEFARRAAADFDAIVKRTYGSTEAPTVATSHKGDPPERGWTTDGRATGDVELRVDTSTGELSVRGAELFVGYLDAADTRNAFDNQGWFFTGDRATLDDGWLTILGRLRDTIIRGGENVDPHEVEAICETLPGIRHAVVIGYPDDEMGERIALAVVSDDEVDIAKIREHCSNAGLARFKTPDRIMRIEELPLLSLGKPDRAALRELVITTGG